MQPLKPWRVGTKVPINVYEGDRPVCQCQTPNDAARIVHAMNFERNFKQAPPFAQPSKSLDCVGLDTNSRVGKASLRKG